MTWEGKVAQAQWLRVGRNSQTSLLTPTKNLKLELQPRNEEVKQSETYKRVYFVQPRGHHVANVHSRLGARKRPHGRPQETHP